MFTLKLFRRHGGHITTKVVAAHHVQTMQIGEKRQGLEIWAFDGPEPASYTGYYIGEPEEGMDAFGREDNHLQSGPYSWWGWGLLENWEGNTSEHYRPASFG